MSICSGSQAESGEENSSYGSANRESDDESAGVSQNGNEPDSPRNGSDMTLSREGIDASFSQNGNDARPDENSEQFLVGKLSPEKRPRGRTQSPQGSGETMSVLRSGDGIYKEELRNSLVLALIRLREKSQGQEKEYRKEQDIREKVEASLSEQTKLLRQTRKDAKGKIRRLQAEKEAAVSLKVREHFCSGICSSMEI